MGQSTDPVMPETPAQIEGQIDNLEERTESQWQLTKEMYQDLTDRQTRIETQIGEMHSKMMTPAPAPEPIPVPIPVPIPEPEPTPAPAETPTGETLTIVESVPPSGGKPDKKAKRKRRLTLGRKKG